VRDRDGGDALALTVGCVFVVRPARECDQVRIRSVSGDVAVFPCPGETNPAAQLDASPTKRAGTNDGSFFHHHHPGATQRERHAPTAIPDGAGHSGGDRPSERGAHGLRGSVIVPNCGHWIQQEQPESVNNELVAFLKGLWLSGLDDIAVQADPAPAIRQDPPDLAEQAPRGCPDRRTRPRSARASCALASTVCCHRPVTTGIRVRTSSRGASGHPGPL
jgi:hypothetical protein